MIKRLIWFPVQLKQHLTSHKAAFVMPQLSMQGAELLALSYGGLIISVLKNTQKPCLHVALNLGWNPS